MVTMKDVANQVGTSTSTVSRVLNGLAIKNKDLAVRIRETADDLNYQPNEAGRTLRMGADSEFGQAFEVRSQQNMQVKRMIAKYAAKLVKPSDVVFLDSGSTIAQMSLYLPDDVLVFTNSLAILKPGSKRGVHVHLAPGLYVPEMSAVFGQETEEYFSRRVSDIYFLSSNRVDVRTGLINLHPLTFSVKRAALNRAKKVVLLVDHDKFCDAGLESFAPFSSLDVIVTDFVPDIFRDAIAKSGIQVIEVAHKVLT